MAPARIEEPPVSWSTDLDTLRSSFKGTPRNIAAIDALNFDPSLQPKHYDILGTHPESKILFLNVNILDSTGREPFEGDVLIEGQSSDRTQFMLSSQSRQKAKMKGSFVNRRTDCCRRHRAKCGRAKEESKSQSFQWQGANSDVRLGGCPYPLHMEWW